MTIHSN